MKTSISLILLLSLGPVSAPAQNTPPAGATVLGTQDSRFTLNGKSAFLYGISYYGALGASEETVRRDLAWYLDLSNERNIRDQRFTSFKELGDLREQRLFEQLDAEETKALTRLLQQEQQSKPAPGPTPTRP